MNKIKQFFCWLDNKADWLLSYLKRFGIVRLLAYLGQLTILVYIILYPASCKARKEAKYSQAWQTIAVAQGQHRNLDRDKAYEYLVKEGISLRYSIFTDLCMNNIDLTGADLRDTYLNTSSTEFKSAIFRDANFENACLWHADLEGADFKNANLKGADFRGAKLKNAKNLTYSQLKEVKTLYQAKIDEELLKEVQKNSPDLLEREKSEN